MTVSPLQPPFRPKDFDYLQAHGISASEAHAQLQRLTQPPVTRQLERTCTVGDGVLRLDDDAISEALATWKRLEGARQFEKWVPASGAASRMFRDLTAGDRHALATFARNLDRFPFADQLLETTRGNRDPQVLARSLIGEPLGFGQLPKALIPFHNYPEGPRSAFDEHIAEARLLGPHEPALTFTVSSDHRPEFERALDRVPTGPCRIHFTEQDVASSTLAWDPSENDLVRDEEGNPLLRPGGHGALLANLNRAASSHLFVRNIDNIQPADRQADVVRWKMILGGLALGYGRRIAAAMRDLAMSQDLDSEPLIQLLAELGLAGSSDTDSEHLRQLLDRPLRVCGVVLNEGEPGGGPFWVRLPNGEVRPQIVESAEVDINDSNQAEIWNAATHFNPVDIACVIERGDSSRFHLPEFADPSAVFVNTRSVRGRDARVLERPGLWNGSMAYWHTVLVEVPASTFAPVKSVFDLLRPEHQPLPGPHA